MAKTKNKKNRRKTNIFIVFLFCSALIWLISKLSESYTQRSSFDLSYANVPDTLLLSGSSKDRVDVLLSASGLQFLSFNFGKQEVKIDLAELRFRNSEYFMSSSAYRKQIEDQLPGNMSLLEIDQDTLFVYFRKLVKKEVVVMPNMTLELAQNHLLEGNLKINPSSIVITGPASEIDTLTTIYTDSTILSELSEDFSRTVSLNRPETLSNTSFETNEVQVRGKVIRFSEQIIDIPVEVVNLPEGVEIKTFPNTVSVLCKAGIDRLKNLRPQEFELVADFESAEEGSQKLQLHLNNKPEDVYDAQLKETEVEFILIRR